MYNTLYELFRRNFPDTVRAESTARRLLSAPENQIFTETRDGRIVGAAVLHKSNLLMLAVDAAYRRQGIGTRLLAAAEDAARATGYETMSVGAGEGYLTPGVPSDVPVKRGALTEAAAFFDKRGFYHSYGDGQCFDMDMNLADFNAEPETGGITYRFATAEDLPGIHACTDDAHKSFTKYYTAEKCGGGTSRALIALDGEEVVGTLIVNFGGEAENLGSVGCTSVKHSHRGRRIGVNLTILGTKALRDAGMARAFLGYTYSGLDRMYGYAGYGICKWYYMAKKGL